LVNADPFKIKRNVTLFTFKIKTDSMIHTNTNIS